MPLNAIRLVSFDALHTIITPRLPIHVQYSQVFAPYLGKLDPDALKSSFKVALKAVQVERPAYIQGAQEWWHEVIRRTGLGAGVNEQTLESSLSRIVPALMARFSSREGYKAFDDALPTIQCLQNEFNIRTAVVSNGDSRIRLVLNDLGFPASLNPIIVSEEEGCEKPSRELFMRTLERVNTDIRPPIKPEEWLHVGDELVW
ncbi:HAD-like domain-containing protein [Crucibulum laeve]|uniref:HAD-like domain-containing protein n=1 Tax=Crucibulum laeve TaxID=68775 RepID=A0A5C3MTS4_9AGAR|nr:HAD-like domain-containing protein [Crucibulum laeve]